MVFGGGGRGGVTSFSVFLQPRISVFLKVNGSRITYGRTGGNTMEMRVTATSKINPDNRDGGRIRTTRVLSKL